MYMILGILLSSCNREIKYEKEEIILMNILTHYINQEENKMTMLDSVSNSVIPIRIEIFQNKDYRDYFQFSITLSNSDIRTMDKMPTKVGKIKNRYFFIYMNDKSPLLGKYLPQELFIKTDSYLLDETSWQVLMCKKCFKYIVVVDNEIIPIEYIKQFNEFTCVCKHDFPNNGIIEDAIIDTSNGILPPPPVDSALQITLQITP